MDSATSVKPERHLAQTRPAPADIDTAFREAQRINVRFRRLTVRGLELARVPLRNQHELLAELFVFEDAGLALGKDYGWKHGAILLWDGTSLEVRKVSLRPSDHYLVATIPKEGDPQERFFIRLHIAMAAAFHGIPRAAGLLVRHRRDLRHRNGKTDLSYGCIHENRDDFLRNRERSRARDRVVLVKAKTARDAKTKLGIRGEALNKLVSRLLKEHLEAE